MNSFEQSADRGRPANPTPGGLIRPVDALVARQLALVGRSHGLTVAQENACRRTIPGYADLELAAIDLRRRAARRPYVGGEVLA